MAKITIIFRIICVALPAGGLAATACNDENLSPRQAPLMLGLAGLPASAANVAGAPSSAEWIAQHQLCKFTAAVQPIGKGVPCTPADTQECHKTCGPLGIGYKKLNCNGSAYAENSTCEFWERGNFGCFKIPEADQVDPRCPKDEVTAPRHGELCTLEPCIVCGGNTREQTSGYRDSTQGLLKVGYCVCTAEGKWSCATMGTAWPCPNGYGC